MKTPLEKNIAAFVRKHQIVLVSLLMAFFSLHLALTDRREVARGTVLNAVLSVTVTPLQRLALGIQGGAAGIWNGYIALVNTAEENEALKKSILSLQEENNKLREDVNLNSRLREILNYKEAVPFRTVAASIAGFHADMWTRTITINKGSSDGIARDMAVVSPLGVVGRVIEVSGGTAKVLMDTDSRSNIDAIVQRSRVKGVAEGNGTGAVILKYIRQVDDIQIGDQIITSGLSGVFPKGLVIGEVTKIEKGKDNFFKQVEVRPSTDIGKLEEVLVVTEPGVSVQAE